MSTASIVDRIRVNNPKVIEECMAAMEAHERIPIVRNQQTTAKKITNPAELKSVMLRGIEKWEKQNGSTSPEAGLGGPGEPGKGDGRIQQGGRVLRGLPEL